MNLNDVRRDDGCDNLETTSPRRRGRSHSFRCLRIEFCSLCKTLLCCCFERNMKSHHHLFRSTGAIMLSWSFLYVVTLFLSSLGYAAGKEYDTEESFKLAYENPGDRFAILIGFEETPDVSFINTLHAILISFRLSLILMYFPRNSACV